MLSQNRSVCDIKAYQNVDKTCQFVLAGYELGSHPNPDSSGNGYARITYVVPSDFEDGEVYPEQILVPASGSSSGSEEEIRSLNSMDEFDGEGNATSGYWEKTSDDTWLYHFKVVDPKQDYVVFENAGLVYSTYNYKYESEQMTPGFVELPGEKTSATITNRLPTGNLNVTKHISGGTSEQKFRFTIKMTDVSNRPINGVYSGVSFQNGEAVFWLSDGESKMIEGLPAGYHYLVDETEVPYYSKSFEPEIPSGTIVANSVADITCTNTYTPPILNPVNVGLRKVETGCFEIAGTYVLRADFRNLIPNTLYSYSIVDERMTFTSDGNGEYYGLQVKLKNEDMAVFERLPVGAQYKFSEPGGDYTASYQIVDLAGGTKINQSASLSPVSGSELSTAWETVDQNEKVIVNFENLLKRTGRLSIKKVVEGLDTGTGYEISILLSNLTAGSKYTAVKGTDNPFVWTANSAGEIIRTLSFQNNEGIEIKGLPVGTKYRVAEATSDGYIPSIFIDESQITLVQTTQSEGFVDGIGILEQTLHEGSDVNVVVKNARKTGSLRLHKIVEGTSTTEETQFNFTIALTYFKNREKIAMIDTESITATLNGEPLSLNFIDGKCIVSLKDQDVLTIEGIYDGVQYEITEEENASYRASIQGNQSGTIRYCENEEVTEIVFTNTYVSPEPSPSTPTPSPSTPPHDPNVPSTGDESSLWLLSMITLFCISVIAALIVIPQIVADKRKREGSSTTK